MAAILKSAILDSAILVFPLKHTHTCQDWFPAFAQKKTSLIHSDSTWWWQPSWILPSWIQTAILDSDTLLSSLRFTQNTLTALWTLLLLIQSESNSFILTQLHNGSHLEFCHLGFSHLSFSSQTHSRLPRLVPTISTNKFTHTSLPNICTKKLHSFILTQFDDGSHLEFCHVGFRHCHLGFRPLVIFSKLHSKTLSPHSDSDSN